MKKRICMILLAAGVLSISACSMGGKKENGKDEEKRDITIVYRSWDYGTEGQDNEERRMIKAFEDTHKNIKIQVCENVSSGNFYWDDIRASVASGIDLADVFMIPNMDWPLAAGYLRNIKEFTDADPEFAKVPDSIKTACSFKSGVYSLPARMNLQGYFVNTTKVRQVLNIETRNLSVNSPYSALEEIIEAAYTNPNIVGLNSAAHFIDTMPSVLDETGTYGYYTWDGSSYHLDSQAFIDSITKAKAMFHQKKTLDAFEDDDRAMLGLDPEVDPTVDAWNKGKLAIRHGYTYEIPDMLSKNELGNSYKFIGNPGGKITIVGDYYGIFKNTAHPQEAYEFAKFMSFGSEGFDKRMDLYKDKGSVNSLPMTNDEKVVDKYFDLYGSSSLMSGLEDAFNYIRTKSMVEGVKTILGFNGARFTKKTHIAVGENDNCTVFDFLDACYKGTADISTQASGLNSLANSAYSNWIDMYGGDYE